MPFAARVERSEPLKRRQPTCSRNFLACHRGKEKVTAFFAAGSHDRPGAGTLSFWMHVLKMFQVMRNTFIPGTQCMGPAARSAFQLFKGVPFHF